MRLGQHTITVLVGSSTTDDYNNERLSWDNPSEYTVEGCSVQPVEGPELTLGRETVVSRWRLYAPTEAPLSATCRVRFWNDDYEVDGHPQWWDEPPLSHVTALLRRAEG